MKIEMRPCPVCDSYCETIYIDKYNDVVGCDRCITIRDAYEWAEECIEDELADIADKENDARREIYDI